MEKKGEDKTKGKMAGIHRRLSRRGNLIVVSLLMALSALAWLLTSGNLGFICPPLADPFNPPKFPSRAWFFSPLERNAFQRLPIVTGKLNDVFVLPDGKNLWAVGDRGVIVHSPDGGRTWTLLSDSVDMALPTAPKPNTESEATPEASWLPNIWREAHAADPEKEKKLPASVLIPDLRGRKLEEAEQLLGKLGLAIQVTDQEYSNQYQAQTIMRQVPKPAAFPPKDRYIRVWLSLGPKEEKRKQDKTSVQTIVKTEEKKQDQIPDLTESKEDDKMQDQKSVLPNLYTVFFLDSDFGWVVGEAATIMRTEDGGQTWRSCELPAMNGLKPTVFDVSFDKNKHGWAVGEKGLVLSSNDGGKNWIHAKVRTFGNRNDRLTLSSLHLSSNGQKIRILSRQGTILRSDNGGQRWFEEKPSVIQPQVYDIYFDTDGQKGWAVGHKGSIYSTENAGQNWTITTVYAPGGLTSVAFASDGMHGIAVGPWVIYMTNDGKNWESRFQDSNWGLLGAAITEDGQQAWVVGDKGTILTSKDKGINWSMQSAGQRTDFRDAAFTADGSNGLVVGPLGTILVTKNSGRSWTGSASGTWRTLQKVQLSPDGERAWVLGATALDRQSVLLSSVGMGKNWISNPAPWARDFQFHAGGRRGWLLSRQGQVYFTVDGGKAWQFLGNIVDPAITSIWFMHDGQKGWATGPKGKVYATVDAGQKWTRQQTQSEANIIKVRFLPNGQQGLAVGASGTVIWTTDGGTTWKPGKTPTQSDLIDVFILPDGRKAAAVGKDGTILQSTDVGRNWQRQKARTKSELRFVHFTEDGQLGVTIGKHGTILRTTDSGQTWTASSNYGQYPAPWFLSLCFVTLTFAIFYIRRLLTKEMVVQHQDSVTDMLASDRPLEWRDPDPLHFRDIALGLSRFLRNKRTEPPLTIAVTGEWGTGKSSLMNLLRYDLRRRGFRPVWFNAWHHQRGEHLLASLFANIRNQAIPSILTPTGWSFRANLLLLRGARYWIGLILTVLFVAFVFSYFHNHPQSINKALTFLQDLITLNLGNLSLKGGTIFAFLISGLLAPLLGAIKALTAFGISPSKLLNVVSASGKTSEVKLNPGVRYRFAREFSDVTSALKPRTMVIFIDDLDRCRKEHVLEVLETVNFLVSSGECYVILGMARDWVLTCIGLSFRELAAESGNHPLAAALQHDMDDDTREDNPASSQAKQSSNFVKEECTAESAAQAYETKGLERVAGTSETKRPEEDEVVRGRRGRHEFAIQYLEKLVNIEIPVPRLDDEVSKTLLAPEQVTPQDTLKRELALRLISTGRFLFPWVGLGLVAVIAIWAGSMLPGLPDRAAKQEPQKTDVQPTDEKPQSTSDESAISVKEKETLQPESETDKPAEDKVFYAGQDDPHLKLWRSLAAVPGALALLALTVVILLRRPRVQTDDSDDFKAALKLLHPWITFRRQSPRSIKRFLNRVRYIAMRYRQDDEPPNLWERFKSRLRHWFDLESDKAPGADKLTGLPEPILVGLSAIYNVDPRWILQIDKLRSNGLSALFEESFAKHFENKDALQTAISRLETSLNDFRTHKKFVRYGFLQNTAQDETYVERFLQVMTDIRMTGKRE